MRPNFQHGQVVQYNKVPSSELQRGDVIVFRPPPSPERTFLKRIVALPGERIEIKTGIVFVDGQKILESYEIHRGRDSLGRVVLKLGEYFVLGDDRPSSSDSRSWGPVPRK